MKPFLSEATNVTNLPTGGPSSPTESPFGVFLYGKWKGLGLKSGDNGKMDVVIV